MDSRSIVHFSAASHELLLGAADRFLAQHQRSRGIIIVTKNKLAADELVYRNSHLGLCGVYRLTVEQLAQELSRKRMAEQGRKTASLLTLDAITRRSVNATAGSLNYFRDVARTPRFSGSLLRTLREIRLSGVESSVLSRGGPAPKDIGILLNQYQLELADHEFTDLRDRIDVAVEIASGDCHDFSGLPFILLCPAAEHKAQQALLATLAEKSPSVLGLSLHHEHRVLAQILQTAPTLLEENTETCLQRAQANLFSTRSAQVFCNDSSFETFSASGEALECVEILRRIGEYAQLGTAFDQIAILLRSPDRYQAVLEEAFDRSKVPGWFSHGCRRPLASGRAFLALLECAREGFSATRFLEYLSLGQAPRQTTDGEENGRVVAPALWERFIVDAAVIGGAERWKTRLDGLLASFTAKYDSTAEENEREALRMNLEKLQGLIDFALPIVALLEQLPVRASWGGWLEALRELASHTLNHPDSVNEVLEELEPLRSIDDVVLEDVLLLLSDRLRSLRRPPTNPKRYGSVFVGAIADAAAMAFDIMFLPGLSETMFPQPIREDPLLLNDVRAHLSSDLRIASDEDERNLLRTAIAAARLVCVGSYPRMDLLTGRARVPSLYFFELVRAGLGEVSDVRQMEADARSGTETSAGWPAPASETDAIDDAEFDLAMLRPALKASPPAGVGAYLTRIDGPLANALRSRWLRWNEREWKWADGIVNIDMEAQLLLDRHGLRQRSYSPSTLQEFAACPYRFALKVVYGLRPSDRPESLQRMDALVRGLLFHRAAFGTVKRLRDRGLLPVTDQSLDVALDILDVQIEEASNEYMARYSPALPAIWKAEVAMIRADLRGWLRNMPTEPQWVPVAAELAFGRPLDKDHDPGSVPDVVKVLDEFSVLGSIDLIEQSSHGFHRVTDYKTGRVPYPLPEMVGGGSYLQPLMYALVAEAILGGSVAGGRLQFATMRGAYKSVPIYLNEYSKRGLRKVLDAIDSSVRNGFLPAAPREGACEYCDYVPVCGPYEEDRTRRKSSVELKPLTQIRGMK